VWAVAVLSTVPRHTAAIPDSLPAIWRRSDGAREQTPIKGCLCFNLLRAT
jgi:hypothetical protein